MASFKDIVQADVKAIFLNFDEFGEMHRIDEVEMLIIIDNNEKLEREKRYEIHDEGLFVKQVLFYVASNDFGALPAVGRFLKLDNKPYKVRDAIDENGIYSILLEANKN